MKLDELSQQLLQECIEHGVEFLERDRNHFRIRCAWGHTPSMPLRYWEENHRCPDCAELQRKRELRDQWAVTFREYGYTICTPLVSHSKEPVPMICPQGHYHTIIPDSLQRGEGCSLCALDLKKTLECMKLELAQEDYRLESDKYVNSWETLHLVCPSGHQFKSTWGAWKSGHRCSVCHGSRGAREIRDFLEDKGLSFRLKDRTILGGPELGFVLDGPRLAIEFYGLHMHSEEALQGLYGLQEARIFHQKKTLQCQEKGYKLLSIFEHEWAENAELWKSMILNAAGQSRKIGARSCELRVVTSREAREFLDYNHIQGSAPSSWQFGLFHQEELVSVMTFGLFHRSNAHREDIMLNRFASQRGILVQGAASRLFNYALGKLPPKPVYSFADLRYSDGNVYCKIGFVEDRKLPPDYFYYKGAQVFSKQALRKKPGEHGVERILRAKEGYRRIWDCGKLRFVFLPKFRKENS